MKFSSYMMNLKKEYTVSHGLKSPTEIQLSARDAFEAAKRLGVEPEALEGRQLMGLKVTKVNAIKTELFHREET